MVYNVYKYAILADYFFSHKKTNPLHVMKVKRV